MSTFVWIDHSEKQRRQILEAIDMFREKDTRDELGIAGIRDAFSEILFPGTGSLQTRARYFFFVPWMYLGFEEAGVTSAEIARRVRAFEISLIDKLVASSDSAGTIGKFSRASLQRFPSNIYWYGLKVLGIRRFPGSQADYHRGFNRKRTPLVTDDREILDGEARNWDPGIPPAPSSFPAAADFELTRAEAHYLTGRVVQNHRESLFAFMLDRRREDFAVDLPWLHPAIGDAPPVLRRVVHHARCFSEVMHGATILYNFYLAEMDPRRDEVIEKCLEKLAGWIHTVNSRRDVLTEWAANRQDFWRLLATSQYPPPRDRAQRFVDQWASHVLSMELDRLRDSDATRAMIFRRESETKGALARSANHAARLRWGGDAELDPLSFRWPNARTILLDISNVLRRAHA
jgi:hypothetical protein